MPIWCCVRAIGHCRTVIGTALLDPHRRQRQAAYLDVDKPDGNRKPEISCQHASQRPCGGDGLGMGWAAANAAFASGGQPGDSGGVRSGSGAAVQPVGIFDQCRSARALVVRVVQNDTLSVCAGHAGRYFAGGYLAAAVWRRARCRSAHVRQYRRWPSVFLGAKWSSPTAPSRGLAINADTVADLVAEMACR